MKYRLNFAIHTILLLGALLIVPFYAASQKLTPQAQISLLTCAPGDEMYSTFGHSAIWVHDPANRISKVYNYGTFDFETEGFLLKFIRGKLNYMLDVDPYKQFDYTYRYFQRSFHAQTLNLTPAQKQRVADYLERNYEPENRFYLYDYFFNNCATQIRDAFANALGDSLIFHQPEEIGPYTLRDITDQYMEEKPWLDLGIDLALGPVLDRPTTHWEYMFHPDYLASELAEAKILTHEGEQPFVVRDIVIFESPPPFEAPSRLLYPQVLFSIFLLVIAFLSWRFFSNDYAKYRWDAVLFGVVGLAGLILAGIWFGTDHSAAVNNYNVLWALPTHLVAAVMLWRNPSAPWLKYYLLAAALIDLLLVLSWAILPQSLHIAVLPILLILILRGGVLYYKLNGRKLGR